MRRAVADRDPNALIRLLLRHTHLAQDAIARMCDLSQAMVSRVLNGSREIRRPESRSRAFDGITHGYAIPTPEMARVPAGLALGLNDSGEEAASVLRRLARADVDHTPGMEEGAGTSAVSPAVLSWLVRNAVSPEGNPLVEEGPVAAVRAATAAFGALDNRFGGENARTTAVHYLNDTVVPLLRRSHTEAVRRSLFTVAAEFVLSIAWMSYDAQRNGAARRYFVQALDLATHAEDRLLGASVMSAMSHQANYLGAHAEARDLARAALTGAGARATATMRAQFLMMEARAHAARKDRSDCFRALGEAERAFGSREPATDPEWIRYFDHSEYSDEVAHCHRDLGHAHVARRLAEQSLAASSGEEYARSRVFTRLVLAAAVLGQGEVEEAGHIGEQVVPLVQATSSARCVGYLDDFARQVLPHRDQPGAARFLRQARAVVAAGQ
ncbi:hypothetical protein [Nocardiopsis quinghaiensis]|uniref:hypothetical protein n=1 Tax=Nocardiopsis quinghaiensis TaxID=464995 RepID=UPI001238BB30|nr:hypothetical protein [Nocardiopsis quinghaiensis]